jgi:hypothetical protein
MAAETDGTTSAVNIEAALREIVDRIVRGFPRGRSSSSARGLEARLPPRATWTYSS